MTIAHVIFDAFGTLVQRKSPMNFRAWPAPTALPWSKAMTEIHDWGTWATNNGESCEHQLAADLRDIQCFGDIPASIALLEDRNIQVHVMSNLASCYTTPLIQALSPYPFQHFFLSCNDGLKKPDPAYYQLAITKLKVSSPSQILFIGDNPRYDVQGPALQGMQAVKIDRALGPNMHELLQAWI